MSTSVSACEVAASKPAASAVAILAVTLVGVVTFVNKVPMGRCSVGIASGSALFPDGESTTLPVLLAAPKPTTFGSPRSGAACYT